MKPPFGVGKEKWFWDNGYGKPRGVVHVGINDGTELGWYLQEGETPILGFEPESSSFKSASESFNVEIAAGLISLYKYALGDKPERKALKIPENKLTGESATQGSSFLTELHLDDGYQIGCVVFHRIYRFDCLAATEGWDMSLYDLLVIDVQGMELQVLKGFGKYLDGFKYLVIECSEIPIYQGEASAQEVCEYLEKQGFQRMTPILSHNDVLFLRQP